MYVNTQTFFFKLVTLLSSLAPSVAPADVALSRSDDNTALLASWTPVTTELPTGMLYPHPHGCTLFIYLFVCLCVCVLPQNCCLSLIISKSRQVAGLKLGILREKGWLSTKQAN